MVSHYHQTIIVIPPIPKVHFLPDFLTFNTAEDTERWRNERRKYEAREGHKDHKNPFIIRNYPTIANVAKKKQQETDRKERRQILDTPLYRYTVHYVMHLMEGASSLRYVNHLIGESGSIEHSQGRGQNRRGGSGKGRGHPPNKRKMNFQTECVKGNCIENYRSIFATL